MTARIHLFAVPDFSTALKLIVLLCAMHQPGWSQEAVSSVVANDGAGSTVGAATESEPAAETSVSVEALRYREQALAALDAERDDLAFELARKAKRLAPEDPQVVFLMALILADRQRFPEAIRMLDVLAEKNPSVKLPAMGQTADWMIKAGLWEEGEERYRLLLSLAPDASLVHRGLANLYLRQGERLLASQRLVDLTRLGDIQELELRSLLIRCHSFSGDAMPETFDPVGQLGIARAKIAFGSWESAKETLLEEGVSGDRANALLGRCYATLGDWKALTQWAKDFESSELKHPDAFFAIGMHFEQSSDFLAAGESYVEAVLLDQTDVMAYGGLLRVAQQLQQNEVATEIQKRIDMISRSQEIGALMAGSPDRSYKTMTELIDLLGQLRRPLESIAWRGLRLGYGQTHGTITPSQADVILKQLISDREAHFDGGATVGDRDFILCGLDLDQSRQGNP
ncbi:tetratricopeptide repeat protein [bacterium]|nr:tetratricopeptide repeat protein [bacterium]